MKKQILITMTMPLGLGGVERSLLGLLSSIDYTRYDVDLLLYAHHGELFPYIDKRANLLPEKRELSCQNESLVTKLRHGCFYAVFRRILQVFRKIDCIDLDRKILDCSYPDIQEKEYDAALGFFYPFNFIKHKVRAKVKVGWIHTDYSTVQTAPGFLKKLYSGLDYIAAVSGECRSAFLKAVPDFADKTIVIENIIPADFIREQSQQGNPESEMPDNGRTKILSAGRFTYAKNFCNVPDICSGIISLGHKVDWYLIGYGPEEQNIRRAIKEQGMEEFVHILGKKTNPYPYMRHCDLYCQPSNFEGKAVTVTEAQILAKPVVITDYPTARSQVNNGTDGIIVPMDNEKCARGIADVLDNRELMNSLAAFCNNHQFSHSDFDEFLNKVIHV